MSNRYKLAVFYLYLFDWMDIDKNFLIFYLFFAFFFKLKNILIFSNGEKIYNMIFHIKPFSLFLLTFQSGVVRGRSLFIFKRLYPYYAEAACSYRTSKFCFWGKMKITLKHHEYIVRFKKTRIDSNLVFLLIMILNVDRYFLLILFLYLKNFYIYFIYAFPILRECRLLSEILITEKRGTNLITDPI